MLPNVARFQSIEDIGAVEQSPDSSRGLFELVRAAGEKLDCEIFETIGCESTILNSDKECISHLALDML